MAILLNHTENPLATVYTRGHPQCFCQFTVHINALSSLLVPFNHKNLPEAVIEASIYVVELTLLGK